MEKVPKESLLVAKNYYLPHHYVFKGTSTTTKMRVVFDGSAKTTNGSSLNDILMVGPKLQDDLYDILIRFRFFKVAMSADVSKMYRQIEIIPHEKDFHRLFWTLAPTETVETYRMTRVAYGIASSAYHSIRLLLEYGKEKDVSPKP